MKLLPPTLRSRAGRVLAVVLPALVVALPGAAHAKVATELSEAPPQHRGLGHAGKHQAHRQAPHRTQERHARSARSGPSLRALKKIWLDEIGYVGSPDAVHYVMPVADFTWSAGYGQFGPMWSTIHTGQDFAADQGTMLRAVADATVTEVAWAGPYGLRTILTLDDGTQVWYAHQYYAGVQPGQRVQVAQPIGMVGSTGNTSGPHLHLEVHPGGGSSINPMDWLAAHVGH